MNGSLTPSTVPGTSKAIQSLGRQGLRFPSSGSTPLSPGSSLPSQSAPSPRLRPIWGSCREQGRRLWPPRAPLPGIWGPLQYVPRPPPPPGPGVLAVGRAPAPGMLRARRSGGGGGGGGGGSGRAVRSRAQAELRSLLAAAPGQPARGRAHKLPAAERGAAPSCLQPPAPTRRWWPAGGRTSRGHRPQM